MQNKKLIWAWVITLGGVVYFPLRTAIAVYRHEFRLLSHAAYTQTIAVVAIVALLALITAFLTRERHRLSNFFLSLAAIATLWAAGDGLALAYCHDTPAFAAGRSLGLRNWRRDSIHWNNAGYWDAPWPAAEAPVEGRRILVIGDSFTFGHGLQQASERFTDLWQQRLPGTRVFNLGYPGRDTRDELAVARQSIPRLHPQTVVVAYVPNDIGSDEKNVFETFPLEHWRRFLTAFSPAYNWYYWRYAALERFSVVGESYFTALQAEHANPEKWQRHLTEVAELMQVIRQNGAEPVLVVLPMLKAALGHEPDLEKTVVNSGGRFVSLSHLADQFTPEEFQVSSVNPHPSPRVHQAIAAALHEALASLL